jgi:hypothetical protein
MRTRRQFRPSFDSLSLRIAPSGGVCPDPTASSVSLDLTAPIVNPTDPGTTPPTAPTSTLPVVGPDGSTSVSPPITVLC